MGDAGRAQGVQDAGDYQAVYTPSRDEKHGEEVARPSNGETPADSPSVRPRWQRLLCELRVLEYAFAIILYIIARRLGKWVDLYKRAIPRIEMRLNSTTTIYARDPSLDQEKLSQHVPMWSLIVVGLAIPIVINSSINFVLPKMLPIRVIAHDFRDHLLCLGQAITLSTFLVNFTKNVTGRFRPCFYDDCDWDYEAVWDGVTNLCRDADGERDGRQSFPSGHASFAWSVMGVLTLYLLGRSRLTCENRSESILYDFVKTFKFFFCFLPCLAAAWVAITRTLDNRHHYSDIVAGSIVGAASACMAYFHNYGSIYRWEHAGLPYAAIHERWKPKPEDNPRLHDDMGDSHEDNNESTLEHGLSLNHRVPSSSHQ